MLIVTVLIVINKMCTTTSTVLPIGPTGATGAQGIFGGFSGEWLFSTSTAVTPAVTQLRLNNATPSSVTAIYISDTNANSIDYDSFLDSISNNSKYGYIRIFKKSDSTKFCCYQVTGVTDNGADHTLTVIHISSNSTFAASDPVVLTFSPAGGGVIVLENDLVATGTANAAMTVLMDYTLTIDQLHTNGDIVEITAMIDTNATTEVKGIDIRIGGTVAHTKLAVFPLQIGEKHMNLKCTISRQSATTLFLEFKATTTNNLYQETAGYAFFETGFSVSNLASNTTLIEVRGKNTSAGTELITCSQLSVKYLNRG